MGLEIKIRHARQAYASHRAQIIDGSSKEDRNVFNASRAYRRSRCGGIRGPTYKGARILTRVCTKVAVEESVR